MDLFSIFEFRKIVSCVVSRGLLTLKVETSNHHFSSMGNVGLVERGTLVIFNFGTPHDADDRCPENSYQTDRKVLNIGFLESGIFEASLLILLLT